MKNQPILLLVSALFTSLVVSSANATILFSDKFDSFSFSGWATSGNPSGIVTIAIRKGNYAAGMKLNRLDDKVSYRTELKLQKPKFEIGKEYWIGFSNFISDDWEFARELEFVLNIHARMDAGEKSISPVVGLTPTANGWILTNHSDANAQSSKASVATRRIPVGAVEKGQWTDWVVHIKFSYQSDGILEVWKDGSKALSYEGPNCYNDQLGPYLKIGLYLPLWRDRNTSRATVVEQQIYYDEVRVGDQDASYADVAP